MMALARWKVFGLRSLAIGVGLLILIASVVGGAWAGGESTVDWITPEGLEIVEKVPRFVGLADAEGNPVRCSDGLPVRVPLDGIPADISVVSGGGARFDSMEEAQADLHRRIAAGQVPVEFDDGVETVVLGPSDVFRPDPLALCDRFGTGPME